LQQIDHSSIFIHLYKINYLYHTIIGESKVV
jgi:hypothetical protein